MNVFFVKDLCVHFGSKAIIEHVDFTVKKGSVTALVGPNGAGKTTLVRVLSRTLKPQSGKILYNDKDLFTLPTKQIAKTLALLPQMRFIPDGLCVQTLVEYGRFPHGGNNGTSRKEDRNIVQWAMAKTHTLHFRHTPLARLSGGEQQRAWIAMALAQKPKALILDEPTTFLDIAYQLEILELLRTLNKETGLTIIMVLHDLNHAMRYSDSIMIVRDKKLRSIGPSHDVLTRESLRMEFSIDSDIHWDSRNNCPYIIPHRQIHHEGAL